MRDILIAVCVTFLFLYIISCEDNKGSILLVNSTRELISRGTVTVCGQEIEFRDIRPSKSATGGYKVKSDSHYDVRIEFKSGKVLEKKVGYVTNGLDFHDRIVITDTDILIGSMVGSK